MQTNQSSFDLARTMFGVIFIAVLLIASFWIVRPFILGFIWAGMVVIVTWPLMIKLQHHLFGKRYFAVAILVLLLILLFVLPIGFLIDSIINKAPEISQLTAKISQEQDAIKLPNLLWLGDIPLFGESLLNGWNNLAVNDGKLLMTKVQPYAGQAASWILAQVAHVGNFLIHSALMVVFSALLYYKGEVVGSSIKSFALCLSPSKGDLVVTLTRQAIRAVALGIVVTALTQSILAGIGLAISGIPYATLLTLVVFFLCLIQVGPLPVLIPAIIWLYWSGDNTWGTVLLVWSGVVGTLDNIIKPVLIRLGANLPLFLILSGVIGGMLAFGLIGLFLGPVVLAVGYKLLSAWIHEIDDISDLKQTSPPKE